ncbi:MAG: hypothetical protein HC771_22415 [Synechococcales cyanobacterium CRU_2_2]|nr:hypothetical protein [Synechococcales cyanobacterium CRU_2_2]
MSSNIQTSPQRQPEPLPENLPSPPQGKAETVKKASANQSTDQPKAPTQAKATADTLDDRLAAAARDQARKDACRVIERAHEVYSAELKTELSRLMQGQGLQDYFRADFADLPLPSPANSQQFEGVTVNALPSAD